MKFIWADGHETEHDVHGDVVPDYYGLPLYDLPRGVTRVVTFKRIQWIDGSRREWRYYEVVPTTVLPRITTAPVVLPPLHDPFPERTPYSPVGPIEPAKFPEGRNSPPGGPRGLRSDYPGSHYPNPIVETPIAAKTNPGGIGHCYYCGRRTIELRGDVPNCGRHLSAKQVLR